MFPQEMTHYLQEKKCYITSTWQMPTAQQALHSLIVKNHKQTITHVQREMYNTRNRLTVPTLLTHPETQQGCWLEVGTGFNSLG